MNPFEFTLACPVPGVHLPHHAHTVGFARRRRCGRTSSEPANPRETAQLRDEVHELKERIKVLERITVDKENSLAKEIESLRDR